MREVKNVSIGGMEFQLLPMPLLEASKWDRKVLQIIAPLVKALGGMKLDDAQPKEDVAEASPDVDFSVVSEALQDALQVLPDDQLESFIKGMTRYASRIDVTPPIALGSNTGLERAFEDANPMDLYKLLFEIARYNKFSPFALTGSGNPISGILGSVLPVAKGRMNLDRLAP